MKKSFCIFVLMLMALSGTYTASAITIFENNGYEVLNNTETLENGKYIDSTQNGGGMIDLILEYNTNPYRKKIDRGVALSLKQRESGWLGKISDHFPYFVKLKVR